jgi:YbgC/YbaW family acyl-CoA thioester hydrolase
MAHTFESERRVEFAETDMAGIVHFANYFRWMETLEHEFFRSLGLALHDGGPGQLRGFARVRAQCEYSAPFHYQEVVRMRLVVREKGRSSLGYEITFSRDGKVCARGSMTVVCVTRDGGEGRMRSMPLPAEIAAAVEVAPQHLQAKGKGG